MNRIELVLAPFKGVTGRIYRNAISKHFGGFDAMYSPFISGFGFSKINLSKLADVIPLEANITPTIPQFISTDAREITLFGKTLQQFGYDHINWNMGCPFSHIADKKRGCGMLPYPDELDKILNEVFRDFPVHLSIKTRLGYYNHQEIYSIIEVLNRYPLNLLIIHARTGTQLYSGEVDTDSFSKCLSLSKHPVAYNGDIYHNTRFRELQSRFPEVKTWMLGRGALINPFLAMEINGVLPTESEKKIKLNAFFNELLDAGLETGQNPTRLLGYLKAVWFYISGLFANPKQVFSAVKTTGDLTSYKKMVDYNLGQPLSTEPEIEQYFRYGVKHLGADHIIEA